MSKVDVLIKLLFFIYYYSLWITNKMFEETKSQLIWLWIIDTHVVLYSFISIRIISFSLWQTCFSVIRSFRALQLRCWASLAQSSEHIHRYRRSLRAIENALWCRIWNKLWDFWSFGCLDIIAILKLASIYSNCRIAICIKIYVNILF